MVLWLKTELFQTILLPLIPFAIPIGSFMLLFFVGVKKPN
jgi:hypothetical protein